VRNTPRAALLSILAGFVLVGCSDTDGTGARDDSVTFRFTIRHDTTGAEDFIALTADSAVIAAARSELALAPEERMLHIHGPIERVDGGRNLSWKWRFTPGEWKLVHFSMELCDGNPSWVEAEIDYWVDTIGVFCPWNSYVEEEVP
jgi:hypothetical protein